MFERLKKDVEVVFDRDPAAKSVVEVLINYPGLHAIWFHRLSHTLHIGTIYFTGGTFFDASRNPSRRNYRRRFIY